MDSRRMKDLHQNRPNLDWIFVFGNLLIMYIIGLWFVQFLLEFIIFFWLEMTILEIDIYFKGKSCEHACLVVCGDKLHISVFLMYSNYIHLLSREI